MMQKTAFLACVLVIFTIFTSNTASAEITEISIASEQWENATNADGTGLFWDIFRKVYEPVGIKVNFKIKSYIGSIKLVQTQKVDAMVGAFIDEVEKAVYPKWNFEVERVSALYKKDTGTEWKGQETLKGKRVGWITGYAYDEYLDVEVIKRECTNQETALRLLDKNRIDFFLNCDDDMDVLLKQAGSDKKNYTRKPCFKNKMYIVFADNANGRALAQIFDERLPMLIKSGDLKKMFDKYNTKKKPGFYPF